MKIGKRAWRMAGFSLLSLLAITAVIAAQVRTRVVNDSGDPVRRTGQVRTAVQSAAGTVAPAAAAATVEPAHAVSRSVASVAPDTRDIFAVPASEAAIQDLNALPADPHQYTASEKAYYATANEIAFYRTGLKFTILDVTIPSDRRPVVTFKITDDKGQPLDRTGVLTPGSVSSSFILAYLPPSTHGEVTDYVDYSTRVSTSSLSGQTVTTNQAAADSGGTYTASGQLDGIYTYRFGTTLPANYNAAATHTLGMYGSRDLTEFGFSRYASNPIKNFVPNGSPVTQVHQVVLTETCNSTCHDPLSAHGTGGRQAVEVCILCHTQQTLNPQTLNTADMKVMIHKIHRGPLLPSVVAGGKYQFITSHGTADFSDVTYPQEIRNCDTCHTGAAAQVNAWMLQPSIEACGSCHDDVNFATGAGHPAGASDNSRCANCHRPTGDFEFDASVAGAHTVPYKSNQLQFPKLTINSITNTAPGQFPVISFKLTDKNGNAMDPTKFSGSSGSFTANLGGPTTEYGAPIRETISTAIATATPTGGGNYTYTFKTAKIPTTATGTWALEFEGRLNATLMKNGSPTQTLSQRDAMDNVVKYFAVTGTTVTPRRVAVSTANCNTCHEKLQLHGSNRNQVEACEVCHYPGQLANSSPSGTQETVSFQVMVHRIHTGTDQANPYIIGNTNFSEVTYPGDRSDCNKCHVGNSFTLPLPAGNQPVVTPKNYWSPTQPIAAACLGCHDSVSTAAHAFLNTTTFGGTSITAEACPVCHQEGADFAVIKSHAR